jgi:hypothetical protein
LAVVVTVAKGYDFGYIWKSQPTVRHPTVKRIPGWRSTPSRDFVVLCYEGS